MSRRNLTLLLGGLAVALAVVVALAPNASSDPDALQKVTADEGFAGEADDAPFELLPASCATCGQDGPTERNASR